MKKYKILIFLLIIIALNILFNWFYYEILTYKLLSFIFRVLFFASFIYILIFLIKKLTKRESMLLNCICLVIFVAYLIFWYYFPFTFVRCKLEMNNYEKERINIINKIRSGEISSNITIHLPKDENKVATDGIVRVYMNNSNGVIVAFNIYYGGIFASDIEVIYSSSGIDGINSVTKNTRVKEIKKLKENWYYVILR